MEETGFKINFDKNTIDHLGIKLYSSFPPVIAEMVSNSYDADAENVSIEIDYQEKTVEITDDGQGMTHDELNSSFLVIGRNRRQDENTGLSKTKKREVTGKKGLGKLAVFRIAKIIEVYSIKDGLKNGFSINYEDLKKEINGKYVPETLMEYAKTNDPNGTKVIIKEISQKQITELKELSLSLSSRFSFFDEDFTVSIKDINTDEEISVTKSIFFSELAKEYTWKFPEDFSESITENTWLKFLNDNAVNGEIYTKKTPLKSSDKGFLLYARKKLASENVFFNDRSNDRFNDYVTGFFNIDFIDKSNHEDLIATARQSVLWDENEDMVNLKKGLDELVKKIGIDWKSKRSADKEEKIANLIPNDYFEGLSPSEKMQIDKVKKALIGNTIDTVDADPIIQVLDNMKSMFQFESFQTYVDELQDVDMTLENVQKIADDWEMIESKELAKVAVGRINAIEKFELFVKNNESETKVIQPFLEKFPWILDPRITTFEREKTFKSILSEHFPDEELEGSNRRMDFLCNDVNGELIIIELKRPKIKITMKEIMQARNYEMFIHEKYKGATERKVTTYLISDRYDMEKNAKDMYESYEKDGKLYIRSYSDLLAKAKHYNQEFINKYDEIAELQN